MLPMVQIQGEKIVGWEQRSERNNGEAGADLNTKVETPLGRGDIDQPDFEPAKEPSKVGFQGANRGETKSMKLGNVWVGD